MPVPDRRRVVAAPPVRALAVLVLCLGLVAGPGAAGAFGAVVSVAGLSHAEFNVTNTFEPVLSVSPRNASALTVTYHTVNGSATAGADFQQRAGATIVIPANAASKRMDLYVYGDTVHEPDESFQVVL